VSSPENGRSNGDDSDDDGMRIDENAKTPLKVAIYVNSKLLHVNESPLDETQSSPEICPRLKEEKNARIFKNFVAKLSVAPPFKETDTKLLSIDILQDDKVVNEETGYNLPKTPSENFMLCIPGANQEVPLNIFQDDDGRKATPKKGKSATPQSTVAPARKQTTPAQLPTSTPKSTQPAPALLAKSAKNSAVKPRQIEMESAGQIDLAQSDKSKSTEVPTKKGTKRKTDDVTGVSPLSPIKDKDSPAKIIRKRAMLEPAKRPMTMDELERETQGKIPPTHTSPTAKKKKDSNPATTPVVLPAKLVFTEQELNAYLTRQLEVRLALLAKGIAPSTSLGAETDQPMDSTQVEQPDEEEEVEEQMLAQVAKESLKTAKAEAKKRLKTLNEEAANLNKFLATRNKDEQAALGRAALEDLRRQGVVDAQNAVNVADPKNAQIQADAPNEAEGDDEVEEENEAEDEEENEAKDDDENEVEVEEENEEEVEEEVEEAVETEENPLADLAVGEGDYEMPKLFPNKKISFSPIEVDLHFVPMHKLDGPRGLPPVPISCFDFIESHTSANDQKVYRLKSTFNPFKYDTNKVRLIEMDLEKSATRVYARVPDMGTSKDVFVGGPADHNNLMLAQHMSLLNSGSMKFCIVEVSEYLRIYYLAVKYSAWYASVYGGNQYSGSVPTRPTI
jgi:hypothetical protein